ncbi:MAG TPA: alpha/beta hydrolase [Candidatus Saccharimonadales bacterium]|nr:alpha/beta hydrolase [Candidatus Saccharimonadales bacterium]
MNVVVNGLMTNYQKFGTGGKTIVLLHGWGDSLNTFSRLAENLKDDYTVYALDLPGMGGTEGPKEAWGLGDYAKFVHSWLAKVGIKKVYTLIGHSNGGAISIVAVAGGTLKPEKLVLIASSGIRNDRHLKRAALKTLSKTGKIITAPLPDGTRSKIRSRFYKRIGSEVGLYPRLEETFRKIVSQDVQQAAKNISIPTLLIYGNSDKSTPVAYGRQFSQLIKGSRLEAVEAGHFPHQESPEKVSRLIKDFLKD